MHPVICQGCHFTHILRTPAWPHHSTKTYVCNFLLKFLYQARIVIYIYSTLGYWFCLFLWYFYYNLELVHQYGIFLLDFRTGSRQCGIFCCWFLSCFSLLFTEIVCYQTSLNLSQSVTSINNHKAKYVFHEKVTISCKPGFKGNSTTTRCIDVNKWSIATPVCTSKYLIWNIISLLGD